MTKKQSPRLDSKTKIDLLEKFSMEPYTEMRKFLQIMQRTAEIQRVKEAIERFDDYRKNGWIIEKIECPHSGDNYEVGEDEKIEWCEFHIILSHRVKVNHGSK